MSTKVKAIIAAVVGSLLIAVVLGFLIAKGDTNEYFDVQGVEMVQLQPPKDGQEIATIDTTEGTFKVMLFREYAPETVERFVNLANSGYYDGKYIFSVEKNVYFLAGTTNSNGTIVDKDNSNFKTEMTKSDNEYHKNLWPLKGSLMSFNYDLKDNGIFFGGINTVEFTEDFKNQLKATENANPDIINAFIKQGGIPNFTHQHTIFAQTYEGMDVFEKICNLPVSADENKNLLKEVKINSIKISTYKSADTSSSSAS